MAKFLPITTMEVRCGKGQATGLRKLFELDSGFESDVLFEAINLSHEEKIRYINIQQ